MLGFALEGLDVGDCSDSGNQLAGCLSSLGNAMEGQRVWQGDGCLHGEIRLVSCMLEGGWIVYILCQSQLRH